MDKLILKAVLFFAKFLVKHEVDFEKLKVIAETKLLMDHRRVHLNWRHPQKENSNSLFTLWNICWRFGI